MSPPTPEPPITGVTEEAPGRWLNDDDPQSIVFVTQHVPHSYADLLALAPTVYSDTGNGFVVDNTDWMTNGDYVVLGDGSEWHWGSGAWQPGRARGGPHILPTDALPGSPGMWFPAGATPPSTAADLVTHILSPSHVAPWGTGQYVMLGDGHKFHWDGHQWQPGERPPPPTGATQGQPGEFTPAFPAAHVPYRNSADLLTLNVGPEWLTPGDYVLTLSLPGGQPERIYWNGRKWVDGEVPSVSVPVENAAADAVIYHGATPVHAVYKGVDRIWPSTGQTP